LEVADIVRMHGDEFLDGQPGWFTYQHLKVYRAITACRTQALGGHLDQCSQCGYRAISYCSCRNRHCPKCQTNARNKWLAARSKELLDVGYFHVVFTLPHQFSGLALQNKHVIYDLLFRTCAETLLEVAADPEHLGAEIGFLSVLHTWGQNLLAHPHIHCVIPSGGLSSDHTAWVHPRYHFFLPVEVLSRVFRGKFTDALKRAFRKGKLVFHGQLRCLSNAKMFRILLRSVFTHDWVVFYEKVVKVKADVAAILKFFSRGRSRLTIWTRPRWRPSGGCARGVSAERFETPLAGGAAAPMRASAFCWRAACQRHGGHPPRPGFPPEGETGKGEIRLLPCCRTLEQPCAIGRHAHW
jgi:hypothetical protein